MLLKKEIQNKCDAFHQQGYHSVNEEDLLDYLVSYRWKHAKKLSIKTCRSDILSVEINDFFDYQQIVAQTSYFSKNDWKNIEDLF